MQRLRNESAKRLMREIADLQDELTEHALAFTGQIDALDHGQAEDLWPRERLDAEIEWTKENLSAAATRTAALIRISHGEIHERALEWGAALMEKRLIVDMAAAMIEANFSGGEAG